MENRRMGIERYCSMRRIGRMLGNITPRWGLWFVLTLAIVGAAGCGKFLNIEPVGLVIPQNAEEYRALITNAYNAYPRDLGKLELRSDIARINENDPHFVDSYRDLFLWKEQTLSPTSSYTLWRDYYHTIYLCNYVIEQAPRAKGSQREVTQIIAEAYLLRAYAHFTLANIYGEPYSAETANLPCIPLSLTTDTETTLTKQTLHEVYAQIEKDIAQALPLLLVEHWAEKSNLYRFSRLSALAFANRVALYKGNWARVVDLSEQLISQGVNLYDMTQGLRVPPCYYTSGEVLQALDFTLDENMLGGMSPSPQLHSLYNTQGGDLRYDTYFRNKGAGKWEVFRGDKGEQKAYRCSFRMGEVYLNICEAYAQMGEMDKAKAMLLRLLKKRLTPGYLSAREAELAKINSKEELLEELLKERAREMPFEGLRWFDLRRCGQPKITHILQGKEYELPQGDNRYTLQIPREAKENNSNL